MTFSIGVPFRLVMVQLFVMRGNDASGMRARVG